MNNIYIIMTLNVELNATYTKCIIYDCDDVASTMLLNVVVA